MKIPSVEKCNEFFDAIQKDLFPYKNLANERPDELIVFAAHALQYSKNLIEAVNTSGLSLDVAPDSAPPEAIMKLTNQFLQIIVLMEILYVYGRIDERRSQMEEFVNNEVSH